MTNLVPVEKIENKIYQLRGKKVLLDKDLAQLYGVPTRVLIQAVKRNNNRFPKDFMFVLTKREFVILRSQIVTSSWGGRRYPPYAFTEQGVAMLSSVLNSERAILVNIQIMRAFAKLRKWFLQYGFVLRQIKMLEKNFGEHDKKINLIFKTIRQLIEPSPDPERPKIGFHRH